tara:strand:+ start:46 stop:1548 length:1503 start_codon:yes stop_codon:yes gene_type:complete
MNVVVIVPDRNITVDKKMLTLSDDAWTFDDSHIHAIHWDGTSGELEFVDTSQNIDLTTVDMVQPYIDMFFSELPKIEKLRMEREEQERNTKENRAAEMQKQQEEQENILKKVRETAEENRRLQNEARITKQRELALESEKAELENKLRFEAEISAKKELQVKLDKELETKTRLFEEDIKKKAESLAQVEESIIKNQIELADQFNVLSKNLSDQKTELFNEVNSERQELDRQRREFLAQKELERKQVEVEHKQFHEEAEILKKERDVTAEKIALDYEQLEVARKQIQTENESIVRDRERLELEHNRDVKKAKDDIKLREEQLEHEREVLKSLRTELDNDQKHLLLQSQELDMKLKNVDAIIDQEKEILEARFDEERARRAIDAKQIQRVQAEKVQREENLMQNEIQKIMRTTDPFDLFDLMGSTSYDINNIPVAGVIAFFIKMGRIQIFCKKYNVTVADIRQSQELTRKLEDYLIDTPNQFTHQESLEEFMPEEYFRHDEG